jgi:hypothetical protein
MHALFIELPAFQRYRQDYLDDAAFRLLQIWLLQNPEIGDVIQGAGGLRKARFPDETRGKGKRGGLRLIYYWWIGGSQFWLFTLYDKSDQADLSSIQRKALKARLEAEIDSRKP